MANLPGFPCVRAGRSFRMMDSPHRRTNHWPPVRRRIGPRHRRSHRGSLRAQASSTTLNFLERCFRVKAVAGAQPRDSAPDLVCPFAFLTHLPCIPFCAAANSTRCFLCAATSCVQDSPSQKCRREYPATEAAAESNQFQTRRRLILF